MQINHQQPHCAVALLLLASDPSADATPKQGAAVCEGMLCGIALSAGILRGLVIKSKESALVRILVGYNVSMKIVP